MRIQVYLPLVRFTSHITAHLFEGAGGHHSQPAWIVMGDRIQCEVLGFGETGFLPLRWDFALCSHTCNSPGPVQASPRPGALQNCSLPHYMLVFVSCTTTSHKECPDLSCAVHFHDKQRNMLQAERIVLKRTADVIDQELGHPPDWGPMTDSNTQLFEVDLSEPTVAGLVSSLKDAGGTVVKVRPRFHARLSCFVTLLKPADMSMG